MHYNMELPEVGGVAAWGLLVLAYASVLSHEHLHTSLRAMGE